MMDKPEQSKAGTAVLERPTKRRSKSSSNGHNPSDNGHQNGSNGNGNGAVDELSQVLASLQSMRDGNFSVRLPGNWTGLSGKIADTFNEIAATNQQMSQELKRVGQAVGKEGKTRERIRLQQSRGAWGEMGVSVNTL
ncbi:MAG TPA: hypothetical protein VLK33_02890, partial [Terriglobales bacterium]|nr:hypothetical protein [Terriglobales bacterium]